LATIKRKKRQIERDRKLKKKKEELQKKKNQQERKKKEIQDKVAKLNMSISLYKGLKGLTSFKDK